MIHNPKNILVVCPYPEDTQAGQRLKYEQYFQRFRDEDFPLMLIRLLIIERGQFYIKRDIFLRKFWA